MDDQMLINRVRSALDELTAGVTDHEDAAPVAVRPIVAVPRRRGPWLAAAAATVVLAGGAVWALGTRSDESVASPDDTDTQQTASSETDPSGSLPPDPAPSTTVRPVTPGVDVSDAPGYTPSSPGLIPGRVSVGGPFFGFEAGLPVMSWRIDGDGLDGFLDVTVSASPSEAVGDDVVEPLEAPSGTARMLRSDATGSSALEWVQDDGSVWTFQSRAFGDPDVSAAWIDLAFGAVPGSGVPIVLADERAAVVAVGVTASTNIRRTYTFDDDDTSSMEFTVADGPQGATSLAGASGIRAVVVDGSPGWLGQDTAAPGNVRVIWDAGGGWWGTIDLFGPAAERADEIIAGIVRTESTPAQRYELVARVEEQDGFDVAILPVDSPFQAAFELRGFSWDEASSTVLPDGRRTTAPLRLIVQPTGEFSAVLQVVDVLGPAPTPEVATACDPTDSRLSELIGLLDQQLAQDLQLQGIVSWGTIAADDGSCDRVTLHVLVDTAEIQAAYIEPLGDLIDLRVLLTPA